MADLFCIYKNDAVLLTTRASRFVELKAQIGLVRESYTGGQMLWQIENSDRVTEMARSLDIPIHADPIPFPARLSWPHTAEDQLYRLVLTPKPLEQCTRVLEAVAEWEQRHGLSVVFVHGQGEPIPAYTEDQLTVVLNAVPPQDTQHNTAVVADHCARVGNTLYWTKPGIGSARAQFILPLAIKRMELDWSALSADRQRLRVRSSLLGLQPVSLSLVANEQASIDNQLRASAHFLESAPTQLAAIERQILSFHQRIQALADDTRLEQLGMDLWQQFHNMPKVADINIHNGAIMVYTTDLVLTHPKTKMRHPIGAFRFKFPRPGRAHEMPEMINLTRRIGGRDHHPHIRPNPCWGNLGQVLPRLISNGEYAAATMMLIAYVETCNLDDPWGQTVGYWPTES